MNQFHIDVLADPSIYSINCLKAHSSHTFTDESGHSFDRDLCGQWYFHYAATPEQAPQGFEKEDFDSSDWSTITVPGHIQLQGYGKPQYINTPYPWDGHEQIEPGQIPKTFNPTGSYIRTFMLTDEDAQQPWLIRFDGVESAFSLWCNGNFVGYSEDSFTPSSFALSSFVKPGMNKLAVQVYRFSSGSWLEDQDFWRFSGIFREVVLYTVPKTHIFDVDAQAQLNRNYCKGTLTVKLQIQGERSGTVDLCLENQTVSAPIIGDMVMLTAEIDHPRLWSAECPNLYAYTLRVKDSDGTILEIVAGKAGFRRFEMRDGLMMLNGKRIVFKGVNRHEWNCRTGRCITRQDTEMDIINMKQHNMNAVRTSHYPNRVELYDLCDQYGLYVIDETNLETHGSWMVMGKAAAGEQTLPGDHPQWRDAVLARANNMYQRDKNHPCILIWSCGNESYGGKTLYEMSQFFRRTDPSRLVHYEGVFHDRRYNNTSDMESQMYTPVCEVEKFLQNHTEKPFIMCEYSHAMGNSLGGISKYSELVDREPRFQGGFIWDYIDQALISISPTGQEYFAYGGDFGDRPTDYQFSCNGIVFADRVNTPKMQEVKKVYQNFDIQVGKTEITVTNKNLFVGSDNLILHLIFACDGMTLDEKRYNINISAQTSSTIPNPFEVGKLPGEYTVTASLRLKWQESWADAGHEVAFGQAVIAKIHTCTHHHASLKIVEGDVNIGLKGDGFSCMFQRTNGGMVSLQYAGEEFILRQPYMSFWRAPIDNDLGWNQPFEMGGFRMAGQYAQLQEFSIQRGDGNAVVHSVYSLPNNQLSFGVDWEVYADGKIQVTLSYLGKEALEIPEFGMVFLLPSSYKQVEYYGLGPDETASDRCQGARLGRYCFDVSENLTPYVVPQECGTRTSVRWAAISSEDGAGILFKAIDDMTMTALPYTSVELESAYHPYELPPISKTVVRLTAGQMGIGGDNSWGAKPLEDYRLWLNPNDQFSFCISPIKKV